jgi:hypothetical protein
MTRSLKTAAAALVAALAVPLAAAAQTAPAGPSPAGPPPGGPPPSYGAAPSYATAGHDQSVEGTIVAFEGKYGVKLRDRRGWLDNVAMHDGTIINPRGLPLQQGMRVTIYGYNAGSTFAANEIDAHVPPVVLAPGPPVHVGIGFGFGWGRRW